MKPAPVVFSLRISNSTRAVKGVWLMMFSMELVGRGPEPYLRAYATARMKPCRSSLPAGLAK